MTNVSVIEQVPIPNATDDALAGQGVRAQTIRDLAVLTNSLAGRGMQLMPLVGASQSTSGGGTGFTTQSYWMRPRYQAVERIWYATAQLGGAVGRFRFGTSGNIDIDAGYQRVTFTARELLSSQSSAGLAVDIDVGPAGSGTGPALLGVSCVEMPRRIITDASGDLGVVGTRFSAGQAIQREDYDNLFGALGGSSYELGRRCLAQWAIPYRDLTGTLGYWYTAISTVSASYAGLWNDSIPALTRKRLRADTQNQITIKVLAWMESAGTGNVRAVSDSGNTSTAAAVTATTPTWHTLTIDVDCTDTASADGRQTSGSPGWDGLQIEYKSDGTNTIYVASVSAYEES